MTRGHSALVALALIAISSTAAADPTKQECIAADEKAQDLRQAGKLRAAREQLAVCIAQSCPGPVREDCAQRVAEVGAAQPTIVFAAKDGAGSDVDRVTVTIDGAPFAEKLDGTALEVDPGDHTFRFESASGVITKHVVVREGDKGRKEPLVLGATVAPASPQTGPVRSTQRTTGIVLGGVGVAGLVVGSIFGALALGAKPDCPSGRDACPAGQQSKINSLHTLETGSDIGFGIGIAGVIAGSVLFFTSPHGTSESGPAAASLVPWIGLGSAGVEGRFQ